MSLRRDKKSSLVHTSVGCSIEDIHEYVFHTWLVERPFGIATVHSIEKGLLCGYFTMLYLKLRKVKFKAKFVHVGHVH